MKPFAAVRSKVSPLSYVARPKSYIELSAREPVTVQPPLYRCRRTSPVTVFCVLAKNASSASLSGEYHRPL